MPVPAQRRCHSHRHPGFAVSALVVTVLLHGLAPPLVHAQDTWPGTVEVSPATLTLSPGQSLSYRVRLTAPPTADGWWIMIHVDGDVRGDVDYKGIRWIPSVGWEFNQNNWNQWRGISIKAFDDAALGTRVEFTHEVWDHNADCPVHNVGAVTITVVDNSGRQPPPPPPPPDPPPPYLRAASAQPSA